MYHRRSDNHENVSIPLQIPDNQYEGTKNKFRSRFFLIGDARRLWKVWQSLSVRSQALVAVSLVAVGWFMVQQLLYWVPRIEKPFEEHPYWRALIFNPLRYFHAKYLDPDRPKAIRQFVMTPERAFFLNMDRSQQRKSDFRKMNQDAKGRLIIERFSAHEWIGDSNPSRNTEDGAAKLKIQKYWEDRYPFLKNAARKKDYGDAGCSIAHLLLWQEKLIDANQDYLFVFEDDVRLLQPLRHSSSKNNSAIVYPIIEAPDVADIVLLVNFAMKRVDVPWEASTEPAVRVLGGFGTMGYIVTRVGALKMIEWLQTSRYPLDLSFFAASSMKVYLPISSQWPTVKHAPKDVSARLVLNEK